MNFELEPPVFNALATPLIHSQCMCTQFIFSHMHVQTQASVAPFGSTQALGGILVHSRDLVLAQAQLKGSQFATSTVDCVRGRLILTFSPTHLVQTSLPLFATFSSVCNSHHTIHTYSVTK